jgi:hypothetical protein
MLGVPESRRGHDAVDGPTEEEVDELLSKLAGIEAHQSHASVQVCPLASIKPVGQ